MACVRIRFRKRNLRQARAREGRRPGKRRWQEAVPAEGYWPRAAELAARPQCAGRRHGLATALREFAEHSPGSDPAVPWCGCRCAAVLAMIASAALRGPVANAREDPRRVGCWKRPQRGQLPSRTPCMTYRRSRPGSRRGAERRAGIRNLRPLRIPPPAASIARNPASRETGGARNAPPGHSAGAAERDAAWTESARQTQPRGPGQPRHAIGVRSACTAGFRPGQPLDSRLPAEAGPIARTDHLSRKNVGAR
jgi:hypothetical protein